MVSILRLHQRAFAVGDGTSRFSSSLRMKKLLLTLLAVFLGTVAICWWNLDNNLKCA